MVRAGVLDKLGPKSSFHDRAQLLATLPDAIAAADQDARNEAAGIMDMFGAVDDSPATAVEWKPARAWNDETRLNGERDTLGLFLTGHPIDQYEKEVRQFVTARINSLQPTGKGEAATIAGLVVALRITRSKRSGDRMAFITLDDKTGRVEVSVFGKTFAEYGELVQKDTLLIFKGGVRNDEYTGGFNLVADEIMDMRQARETFARRLRVAVPVADDLPQQLQQMLSPYQGGNTPVLLDLDHNIAAASFWLGDEWKISPHESLVEELRVRFGENAVRMEY
jgi:DNA polymerase-3 subunit alpha